MVSPGKFTIFFFLVQLMAVMAMDVAKADDGWIDLHRFKNAPFPDESRSAGHTYDGKFYSTEEHYSDNTVGIYIPPGFKPGKAIDFVVHFHGWNNHVSNVFDRYQLKRQFNETGLNAILLVPEGPKDAPDSSGGKLERVPGAFKLLMEEILTYLKEQKRIPDANLVGKITLTAHSGGYNVVSAILKRGGITSNITDVVLFDASYGGLDGFIDWSTERRGRRLVSIFTEHLAVRNYEMLTMLKSKQADFIAIMDKELTPIKLSPRKPIFIHTTDIVHDEVMQKRDYFKLFLMGAMP